jgi:protein SCO1
MSPGFLPLLGLVLATGIGTLGWETDGFRVLTTDGAQRLAVERAPLPVPDARLVDQNGDAFSLGYYRGKTLMVEFIYTRCPTICGLLGDDVRRVLALTPHSAAGRAVDFLSISFDPQHDDRRALALYAETYGASAPRWRVAVPANGRDLAALLRTFGVVVIPDGMGGFVHNGAFYLVDARGRLRRILDSGTSPQLLAAAAASGG